MSDLPDNLTALSKPDLFEAFKLQLIKDVEYCGLNADFVITLTADYEIIFTSAARFVKKIMGGSENKLSELLYRIDISEAQIAKLMKDKRELEFSDIIAELIIKRELQKVVLKKMFK
jgi:hypothetical protein